MGVSGMVDEQLKSLEDARKGLESQALKIIAEIQDKILDYNRENQLFAKGQDATGSLLKPYSNFTIALKKQKGEVYNRTTLLDTEDFYKGFYLTAKNGSFNIFSSDEKTDKLKARYGDDIFGLNSENEGETNNEIFEKLLEWITTRI